MTEREIQDRVFSIFLKRRPPGTNLSVDTPFDQLQVDSLEIFSLVFDLEDAFEVSIPDDAVRSVRCIRDVVEAIQSSLRERSQAALGQGYQT
ncbi:MAG TPA: phosphopantetheine-binding protein [Acidobacteriota bacterium]|jgi:acyl carrier protein